MNDSQRSRHAVDAQRQKNYPKHDRHQHARAHEREQRMLSGEAGDGAVGAHCQRHDDPRRERNARENDHSRSAQFPFTETQPEGDRNNRQANRAVERQHQRFPRRPRQGDQAQDPRLNRVPAHP